MLFSRSIIYLSLICLLTVQFTFFATSVQASHNEHPAFCAYTSYISGEKTAYLGDIHLKTEDVGKACYDMDHKLTSVSKFFDGSDVGLDGVNIVGMDVSAGGNLFFTVDQSFTYYNPNTGHGHPVDPNSILMFTFADDSTEGNTKGSFSIVGATPDWQPIVALSHVGWGQNEAFQIIVQDFRGTNHLLSQAVVNGHVSKHGWTQSAYLSQSPIFQSLNTLDVSALMIDNKVVPSVNLHDVDDSMCREAPSREPRTTQDLSNHLATLPPDCTDILEVQGFIGAEAMFALDLPVYLPATSNEPLDGSAVTLSRNSSTFDIALVVSGTVVMIDGMMIMVIGLFIPPGFGGLKALMEAVGVGFLFAGTIMIVMAEMDINNQDEEAAINASPFPKITEEVMSINPIDDFVDDKSEPIQASAVALTFSNAVLQEIASGHY